MRGQERHLSLIRGFYVNTTAILETGAWLAPEPQRCSQPCELRPQHSCSGDEVSPRGPNFFLPQPGGSGMKSGPRDTDPGQSLDVERTSLGEGSGILRVCGRQRGREEFLWPQGSLWWKPKVQAGRNSSGTQVDPHLPSL